MNLLYWFEFKDIYIIEEAFKMKVNKNTEPYSIEKCKWDKDSEEWLFSWGEEIPNSWIKFSIKHEFPVESINEAHEKDPNKFELDENIIIEILEDD